MLCDAEQIVHATIVRAARERAVTGVLRGLFLIS
jgi:hypothetical protein